MITNRNINLAALLCVLILAAACTPTTGEPGVAQGPEVLVFPASTEKRLVSTDDIPLNNCNGSAEVSQEVELVHTVLRTLELGTGITVDAGGRAGIPGVGEVGVGAAVANHYQINYGTQDAVARSLIVKAKEGTNILHTVRQYEIWETGELLVSPGSANLRIPYSFRRGFDIEMLPPANIGCPGQGAQPQPPTTEVDGGDAELQAHPNPTQLEIVDTPSLQPLATLSSSVPSQSCQEAKGENLQSPPSAPPRGCVLIIEWWVPPNANDCGILITYGSPSLPGGSAGTWWYTDPGRPAAHIQEFRQKYPYCKVDDLR